MIKHIFLTITFCAIAVFALNAQQLGLYFVDGVIQSNALNPAFVPKQKVAYSFPGFNAGFSNSAGAYNDFISTNSEGLTVLNGDHLLSQLSDNNFIRAGLSLNTYQSVFGKKHWRVSFSHALKMDNYINIPKDMVELLVNGNANAMGKTFNIAPDINTNIYSETGLGFMIKSSLFNFGGRVKLLSGIANVTTDNTSATLNTNDEYYQLEVATDYRINAAGLVDITNPSDISDLNFDLTLDELSLGDMIGKNMSVAIDLGATMTLMDDKLTLAASVIDIGKLKWSRNPYNFHSNGEYTFEGVDVRDMVEEDEFSLDGTLDTLKQIFDFDETNTKYTTALPMKVYLSGNYKFSNLFSAGGLLYYESYRGHSFTGYGVNTSVHLSQIFNVGLSWTSVYQANSLGAHAMVKLGPIQLFALTDNIMAAFKPYESQNLSAQFGLNLLFK